jgi:hypothetical protein
MAFNLACVKVRSRASIAFNLLPSIATLSFADQIEAPARHHERTADSRIASPLSLRKSAIVMNLA